MDRTQWKKKIIKQCKEIGTYNESYMSAIEALSQMLEQRDKIFDEFSTDAKTCVEHVSDRGARNMKRNPLLQTWMELNRDALAYWRDLGLTPAGFKRLNVEATQPKQDGFEVILAKLLVDDG